MSSDDDDFDSLIYELDDAKQHRQNPSDLQESNVSDDEESAAYRDTDEFSSKKYSKNPKTNDTTKQTEDNDCSALDDLIGLIDDDDDDDDANDSNEITPSSKLPKKQQNDQPPKSLQVVTKELKPPSETAAKKPTTSETILNEPNSGIKLSKPMFRSDAELASRLACMGRFYRVSQLKQSATYLKELASASNTTPQDWFTVGLIGFKTDSRHSAKGNRYVIWHMYDLNNLDSPQQVSLFLFGTAYDFHWKASELEVYAILKPDFMSDNNKGPSSSSGSNRSDEVSLCVRKEAQLVKLGLASEVSRCQYVGPKCKSSDQVERCKKWVHSSRATMCTYHCIMNNKSKNSFGFGQNSNGKNNKNGSMYSKSGMNNFGGFKAKNNQTSNFNSSSSNWPPKKEPPQDDRWKSLVTNSSKTNDSKLLASFSSSNSPTLTTTSVSKPNNNNRSQTYSPMVQSSAVVSSMPKPQVPSTETSSSSSSTFPSGTYAGLLASKLAKKPLGSAFRADSTLSKSKSKEENFKQEPSSPKNVASLLLKKKINEIKRFEAGATPKIKEENNDSNSIKLKEEQSKKVASSFDLDECLSGISASKKPITSLSDLEQTKRTVSCKRALCETTNEEESGGQEDQSSKKSKLIDDLLKIKSNHAKDVFDAEKNPHYKAYLTRLEQQERIDEKLCSMRNREVKAVSCSVCAYTSFKQSDFCKFKRHNVKFHLVLQRFFKCKSCNWRTHTLDKLCPTTSCEQCGGQSFMPCAFKEDTTSFTASREALTTTVRD